MRNEITSIYSAIRQVGGNPYMVGGSVRDTVVGNQPKDIDTEVFGISAGVLVDVLAQFGSVNAVGVSFGVIKLRTPSGNEYDFSLPRRDSKTGQGHKGFMVQVDHTMTIAEAARRRDFTINAISIDGDGNVVDPYNGMADLQNRVLRHTSDQFGEDPLRVLRGMQFAARMDLTVTAETAALCRGLRDEYHTLAKERIWGEWEKWASKGIVPSQGLEFLNATGWVHEYPELAALIGVPQEPEWHPEGVSLQRLTLDSSIARAAMPIRGDNHPATMREFVNCAMANDTTVKAGYGATTTETIGSDTPGSFTTTIATGMNRAAFSDGSSVATDAKPICFVFRPFSTGCTAKGTRIVFKVPFRGVKTIVDACGDDDEVIWRIVGGVAIHVMDMLRTSESAFENKLHDNTVNADRSISARKRCIEVTARMDTNSRVSAINRNVTMSVLLAVGDGNIHTGDFTTDDGLMQFVKGSVWTHTKMVCDAAAAIAIRENLNPVQRATLVFGALCHDFGKPATTVTNEKGQIVSPGHDREGVQPTITFMTSIGAPASVIAEVAELTQYHMRHIGFEGGKAARRLANQMTATTPQMLGWIMEADHSGRPWTGEFMMPQDGIDFIASMTEAKEAIQPILMGRHLIEMGVKPGPQMGHILRMVQAAQVEGTVTDFEQAQAYARSIMQ